jgi:hypothetical protein
MYINMRQRHTSFFSERQTERVCSKHTKLFVPTLLPSTSRQSRWHRIMAKVNTLAAAMLLRMPPLALALVMALALALSTILRRPAPAPALMIGAERRSGFAKRSKRVTSSRRREDTDLQMSNAVKQLERMAQVVTARSPTTFAARQSALLTSSMVSSMVTVPTQLPSSPLPPSPFRPRRLPPRAGPPCTPSATPPAANP